MTAATLNLNVARGITLGPILVQCKDATGAPVDLTGWSVFAEARLNPSGPLIVDLAPQITSASSGEITIAQTAAQTTALRPGNYQWDLVFQRPTGERLGPYVSGNYIVSSTITR